MNLAWALRRVSVMSAGEIGWRVRQQAAARLERLGARRARPSALEPAQGGRAWISPLPQQFDASKYARAADSVLAGEFHVFAMRSARLGFPPRWNRDPKTGREAPLKFGKTLDYRDEALVGDIKYLWEPARFAELVTLAQAWRLTREERYLGACRTLVDSFIAECPYPLGAHWVSSLELGVRLINWSFAWHLLGGEESPLFATADGQAFRRRWLDAIYRHCHFIAGYLSRYSSANNHLLGELTGLLAATLTWPYWRESAGWRDQARRELEEQALLQNGPDGVNREQAVWYHQEVADMMLVAGLLCRANGLDFRDEYWRRLESMIEFVASIMDASGAVPAFGDADDAVIARFDPDAHTSPFASLLAIGAVVFERPAFARKAPRFDDKARWLLGDAAAERFRALQKDASAAQPLRRTFEDAGYYVLGARYEARDELRIVCDAGPLGYESIAAHGHADALSFTLSAGGRELLIDPGTYAYHTQKRWRDYFRGTSAHNTVRVDGVDQSTIGGAFMWLTHAPARVLALELNAPEQRIVAEHEGYLRLADPVRHRRELRLDTEASRVRVVDALHCAGTHEVEVLWHFSEECDVELSGNRVTAWRGDVGLVMTLPPDARCTLVCGAEEPPLGWRSHRFDERVPAPSVRAAVSVRGDAILETEMQVVYIDARAAAARSPTEHPISA